MRLRAKPSSCDWNISSAAWHPLEVCNSHQVCAWSCQKISRLFNVYRDCSRQRCPWTMLPFTYSASLKGNLFFPKSSLDARGSCQLQCRADTGVSPKNSPVHCYSELAENEEPGTTHFPVPCLLFIDLCHVWEVTWGVAVKFHLLFWKAQLNPCCRVKA